MSDMTALLNDLSYIPLNNEQNEPTQGDIGETSNESTQAKRNEFEELYVSANEELYPGCDYVTQLDFMAKFTYFKVKGKLTDSIFNEMLELFQNVFPTAKGYKLPPSYYAIKKTFKMIGLGYESIHACVNDCFLFRGDANKDVHFCPTTSLYKSSHTAKEMTWHATGKCTEPGKMQHPDDGRAWKEFDTKYPDFAAKPRNIRLWLAADGKDVDVYLRMLIDDLKDLWAKPDVMHIEKNVLESILNTLLMNDKSKDTAKARQDLERLGIRSGLCLEKNKNRKCSKPQATYSFTPEDRKKFCQFINGVKLPDGFRSNFKHKVIDNDTNITGLKSHDLMVDDMLKAHSKVIDILCNLKLIYPPAFFYIMIHLVIYLPLEAIFSGPIRLRGYVAEEALTFSAHYLRDVTMKFNHLDRNVDCPPPTCQFQVFKSLCKSIGLRSVIRIDHQELKKVIWYVLHNSPEIDTYRAKFKSEFPNKYMKEEFPSWFGKQIRQRHVDNDPGVSESNDLFALTCGPSQTPILDNSCVVNVVRFVVHSRDERRTTQNSGICSPGPDEEIRPHGWKVAEHVSHKKSSNGGVIMVEDDPDVIHVDNSSDLALSTSLNDLEIAALHIDGQSIDVDAPPDIIDVVDEDDDIIDEEYLVPHDLVDSNEEDLANLNIDDGMSADVARGYDGDSGGDDRPPPYELPTGCGGCLGNRGTQKPNLGGKRAGRLHARQETRNLGLKAITNKSGPIPIRFKELPLHYPSWRQMSSERKAGVVAKIRPSLNCVPTWNSIDGHKSMRPSSSICKSSIMARRLLSKKDNGFLKKTGLMTWSASDADVPRTFPR
nr:hypothetical protein [Tanacetum cinerariifolium]